MIYRPGKKRAAQALPNKDSPNGQTTFLTPPSMLKTRIPEMKKGDPMVSLKYPKKIL